MSALPLLAFAGGAAIAIQATFNAQLGVLLRSPILSTAIAFLVACSFTGLVLILSGKKLPDWSDIKSVPIFLWFSGGALSAFGVGMFYYLIPKMGVGPMMSYALSGQIIIATIASHYGWFDLPESSISSLKVFGIAALTIGLCLINWESNNGPS